MANSSTRLHNTTQQAENTVLKKGSDLHIDDGHEVHKPQDEKKDESEDGEPL